MNSLEPFTHVLKISISVVMSIVWSGLSLTTLAASPPPDLDALVEQVRKEFDAPGIALAIVKDGDNVLVKGYGKRRMNEAAPVDGETVFNIGSNSKGFTAAAVAILVDEGKIHWDDAVIKYLPDFQMYDPWVTREITVRDLLSHRSGLGRGAGDLLRFPDATFTSDEIIFRLRFVKPAASFRSRYAYNNCHYVVAGKVLCTAAGRNYDDLIRERIFKPLDMKHSTIGKEALSKVANKATSHVTYEGKPQTIGYMNGTNDSPVSGINSCASDMAKWALMLLNRGTTRGAAGKETRILSRDQAHELWSTQMYRPNPADDPPPEFAELAALKSNFSAYGLGFELADMAGRKIVSHSGSKPGQTSATVFVPELKLGVVILSNKDSGAAVDCLKLHILSYYLGSPAKDWVGFFARIGKEWQSEELKRSVEQAAARRRDTKPSLPLEKYAGDYTDAWYGNVNLSLEGERLVLRFGSTPRLVGDLEHWHNDTFVARWRERALNGDAFVYFALKPDGTIERMRMKPFSSAIDFSFDFEDLEFKPRR